MSNTCSNCGSSRCMPNTSCIGCGKTGQVVLPDSSCIYHTRTVQPLASASADVPFTVSPDDIVRFNKSQIERAKTNLNNAKSRGDKKAAENIQRKIAIYKETIQIILSKT